MHIDTSSTHIQLLFNVHGCPRKFSIVFLRSIFLLPAHLSSWSFEDLRKKYLPAKQEDPATESAVMESEGSGEVTDILHVDELICLGCKFSGEKKAPVVPDYEGPPPTKDKILWHLDRKSCC